MTVTNKQWIRSGLIVTTQHVYNNLTLFGFSVLQMMITLTPHTLCGSGSASALQLCCVLQTLGDSGPCCGDGGPRYTLQLALNCSVNRRETRKHQFCRCPSFYLQLWFSALRADWQRTITLVCSVWAADRNTAHLKQFFRFIQTFLHRLEREWDV